MIYISVEQSQELDKIVKSFEVAFRSFVSQTLYTQYSNVADFDVALRSISISEELIYSRRFTAKVRGYISGVQKTFNLIESCNQALTTNTFNNDVPYVSDIIDLLLVFFNSHFLDKDVSSDFSSIEEFHYCCTLYHKSRNNLSHPASRPTTMLDANKLIYFIENVISALDNKYFWFSSKEKIKSDIEKYKKMDLGQYPEFHNLNFANSTHKNLLCRESIIEGLYDGILGSDARLRVAGSIVLYGYGGVGKTAITTEFLYRLMRDKVDGKHKNINFLLFFSSKDEYLRNNKTTGELYIDSAKPEFSTLDELILLICGWLNINDAEELKNYKGKGIVAIDNIENIEGDEKDKIINFIKSLPRTIQFIVTSRNEEPCEEKLHVEEFKSDDVGSTFIEEVVDSEGFNVDLDKSKALKILEVSKGNALIIMQILNILDREVSTFDEVIASLGSMQSKNSEMIANFMYKNTFDNALKYLNDNGYPVNEVMQIISLYDERIELYSISKLVKIDIADAEKGCNYLLERLVLKKVGEYYELNEFAKRFVFIKLLPDRIELSKIKDKIKNHKERMKEKLGELDDALKGNTVLYQKVNEWQPKNYIDKIVIAELFSLYGEAIICVGKRDKKSYERYLKEFDDHSFITNHPYVPLQKARLIKEGIKNFYRGDKEMLTQVEHCYEQAIESVEYDYRYLVGSVAHASLLMLFGVFLSQQLKQYGRAIRYLEDAKKYHAAKLNKGWFVICNYLSIAYEARYIETKDQAYRDQLRKVYRDLVSHKDQAAECGFDVSRYEKKFSKWLS